MCHSQNTRTEDETFAALKRAPFNEMRLIIRDLNSKSANLPRLKAALKRNGWTVDLYQTVLGEWIKETQ